MGNPAVEHQTKHIDIQDQYIQEQYENKVIEPYHISGVNNLADLFTKSLPVIKVEQFRSKNSGLKSDYFRIVQFSGSVEMESCEMYSELKLNIPTGNCIRSLHSSYLCK